LITIIWFSNLRYVTPLRYGPRDVKHFIFTSTQWDKIFHVNFTTKFAHFENTSRTIDPPKNCSVQSTPPSAHRISNSNFAAIELANKRTVWSISSACARETRTKWRPQLWIIRNINSLNSVRLPENERGRGWNRNYD